METYFGFIRIFMPGPMDVDDDTLAMKLANAAGYFAFDVQKYRLETLENQDIVLKKKTVTSRMPSEVANK
ncbi:hypothetical protein X801_06365 [Opisthorchis viverrini]|uniref:Uncharacterized protein n=1 Tax=Opisthorchis viverrini TaxID=6198 RepID=A0A1S8WTS0_OPIVI|nr:hypothetical protein X801_06365 [Opisthorchis viverrini]